MGKRRNVILGLLFGGLLASNFSVDVVEADKDVLFCIRGVVVLLEYVTFDFGLVVCSF